MRSLKLFRICPTSFAFRRAWEKHFWLFHVNLSEMILFHGKISNIIIVHRRIENMPDTNWRLSNLPNSVRGSFLYHLDLYFRLILFSKLAGFWLVSRLIRWEHNSIEACGVPLFVATIQQKQIIHSKCSDRKKKCSVFVLLLFLLVFNSVIYSDEN